MSTLTDFLTGIANAIRTKKGTTASILASNFATEISNLPSGDELIEEKTINDSSTTSVTFSNLNIQENELYYFVIDNNASDNLIYGIKAIRPNTNEYFSGYAYKMNTGSTTSIPSVRGSNGMCLGCNNGKGRTTISVKKIVSYGNNNYYLDVSGTGTVGQTMAFFSLGSSYTAIKDIIIQANYNSTSTSFLSGTTIKLYKAKNV